VISNAVLQPCGADAGATAPAETIRTIALLVAIARGGLTMRLRSFRRLPATLLALGCLPYAAELVTESFAARTLLGPDSGVGAGAPMLVTFLAASIWAPLSPSIVIRE
jgi:hypothetical protein